MKTLLKWAGGKSQLLPIILNKIPSDINTYIEPFLGGGAVALALQPRKAILTDYNQELINVYQNIKNNVSLLIDELNTYENTLNFFKEVRLWDRMNTYLDLPSYRRAARFIYLNKTSFNGLYRVNQKGQYNSPFGYYKNPTICNQKLLYELHQYFNNNDIKLNSCDFEVTLNRAKEGDFVYLDPPYIPITSTANFTSYTKSGFTLKDHQRLLSVCDRLTERKVKFLLSNSYCEVTLDLYKHYHIEVVHAKRNISCKLESRAKVKEILVSNY